MLWVKEVAATSKAAVEKSWTLNICSKQQKQFSSFLSTKEQGIIILRLIEKQQNQYFSPGSFLQASYSPENYATSILEIPCSFYEGRRETSISGEQLSRCILDRDKLSSKTCTFVNTEFKFCRCLCAWWDQHGLSHPTWPGFSCCLIKTLKCHSVWAENERRKESLWNQTVPKWTPLAFFR